LQHPVLSERVRKVLGRGNVSESITEESDSDVDDSESEDSEDDGSNDDQDTDDDENISDYDTEDSTDSTSYHDALVKDVLYIFNIRDEYFWELPDVTSQLKKLNHGKEVLYTRKFEKQLMDLMGGDHDEDDEEFFL
jgi:ribosome-binding ATPase YchF (GTP1/OBG family)